MGITAFRIQNSLSFQDTEWIELRPLTFYYGENSAGKSNIHHIFQTVKASIIAAKTAKNDHKFYLFNFRSLLPLDSSRTSNTGIQLAFRFDLMSQVTDGTHIINQSQPIDLKLTFRRNNELDNAEIQEFLIETAEKSEDEEQVILYGIKAPSTNEWKFSSDYYKSIWDNNDVWSRTRFEYTLPPQLLGLDDDINKLTKIDIAQDDDGQDLFNENNEPVYLGEDISESVRFAKNSVKFISGLLKLMQIEISDMFENYAHITPTNINNDINNDINPETNHQESDKWIKYALPIRQEGDYTEWSGTGQVKINWLVQLVADLRENTVCFLEHPDVFLGPKVQGNIVDFLITMIYRRKVTFIIETHSEFLLLRLRKRIRQFTKARQMPEMLSELEENIRVDELSTKVCVLLFKKDIYNHSKLTTLHLNKNGEFQEVPFWPDNFLEDAFKEKFLLYD